MIATADKLTATRCSTYRRCRKQHYYRYELGLTKSLEAHYFRFGRVFHHGVELWNNGMDAQKAIQTATEVYDVCPDAIELYKWQIERETVANLLAGYFWQYQNDDIKYLTNEQAFEYPLINPETGAASRTFVLAGKMDAIAQMPDTRLALMERKTTVDDIDPNGKYWLRLRADGQISQYVLAARQLGYNVHVIYDVARKPSIKPRAVPLLDDAGCKIVLDRTGTRIFKKDCTPRQTASTKDGFVLQTRPETPEEYGTRLLTDIGERPDFYFQRREIPRLEDELEEFQLELWQQGKEIMESRRYGRWFRDVGKFTCPFCEYEELCLNNITVDADRPPVGFYILDDVHPELAV